MQRRHLYILSVCITFCLFGLEVKSARIFNSRTDKIPSPAEMLRLTDSFSPEEISQLEIDDVLRDRLHFDPQWQEIAQAVRQELSRLSSYSYLAQCWFVYRANANTVDRYKKETQLLLSEQKLRWQKLLQ